jgi:hypothetical protein
MNALEGLLKWVGAVVVMAAFGIAVVSAVMAGMDPVWAIVRSAGASVILLMVYSTLCKIILPLAASLSAPNEIAEPKKR